MRMASGPAGDFVIRADPERAPQGLRGVMFLNWFARPRSKSEPWTIRVRRRSEDPFGPAVATETTTGDQVRERVEGWTTRIFDGWKPG